MSNSPKLTIGLFGFGTVGEGIYQVLQQTPSLNARIKKICIKDPDKNRSIDAELFTTEYKEILDDPEINVIVELINDANEAYKIVTTALRRKKAVVSANKKMIAEHLSELIKLQKQNQSALLYEAAVCGSIPIIRNLEEYYDNELLQSICGIVNGSTNYILTRIIDDNLDYKNALLQAQMNGFAETDPSLDVKGIDAVNKLTILLLHAYGIISKPIEILHLGIDRLHPFDTAFAGEKDYEIKLTAQAIKLSDGNVAAFVLPQFVTSDSQLYGVKNEFNGVVVQSSFADKQFLYGKGAGRYPTSSAVLSDLSALRYDYKYEYRRHSSETKNSLTNDFYLSVYISFNALTDIELKDFEYLEEFYCQDKRHYLVGTISFKTLLKCSWLQDPSISLILCPHALIQNLSSREIREQSLKLAGVNLTRPVRESIQTLI